MNVCTIMKLITKEGEKLPIEWTRDIQSGRLFEKFEFLHINFNLKIFSANVS